MSNGRIDAIGGTLITTDPAAKMILRHMNEQRAVESRTVRAGDGRSRNVVIRDQFIIEDLDETHLLVKTDMLDEIKAEFQAQLEEFTFKAQVEAESGNAKPKQR
ncbi:hypothetical protein NliqN6_4495 [Naganishia liquefaciens]|uniref:General transcription and DNA repair factor IIH subunit TFB5 n=1 Tax=Naganishia liquefaciens TaxID=104408 RepID=A0A8H3TVX9_9TREE|nr:hypothetical protein NliqN6_4495 [Naganishia liquefaciens]